MTLGNLRALAVDQSTRPLEYMRWTPPQWALLTDAQSPRCLRTGEQVGGKSTAGAAGLIDYVTGTELFQPRRHVGPVQAWVITFSVKTSLAIQEKVWNLTPKDLVADHVEFLGKSRGMRGKYPAIDFKDGSTIRFLTTEAGLESVKGATCHYIWIDEPTTREIYHQCKSRLRRTNGILVSTLTPLGKDTTYLREEVEAGNCQDHCFPLSVENLTPVGSDSPLCLEDGTPMDEEFIRVLREQTPPSIADTSLDGAWEERGVDRWFSAFVADPSVTGSHVTTVIDKSVDWKVCIGVDLGHKPGKYHATLVLVEEVDSLSVRVFILDEYTDPDGLSTNADHAQGILEMLARHGWTWRDVDYCHTDRVHLPGSSYRKSAKDLQAHIAKQIRIPSQALRPAIRVAQKGRGSIEVGRAWLHEAMVRPGSFRVHPRCIKTIEALNTWNGSRVDSDAKDGVDATRYALSPFIFSKAKPYKTGVIKVGPSFS